MIKIINERKVGSLYHYAHFICDCLFPEIINNIYLVKHVIRLKNLNQTIGNFHKIYRQVMGVNILELNKPIFDKLTVKTITCKKKEEYVSKPYFNKFRNYIFSRFNINHLNYDINYPEVILIKRNGSINLIDDEYLSNINTNVTTGKERREINNIIDIEKFLNKKYENKFKSLYFENLPFEEQIKYFNNSKLIICAHGAVMSNMFFCKEGTKIIEVTCGCSWRFFDIISNILNLNLIKCHENSFDGIIKYINKIDLLGVLHPYYKKNK